MILRKRFWMIILISRLNPVAMNGALRNGLRSGVKLREAVCEWSEGDARDRLKYEIDLQHMCEVKRNTRNRLSAEGNKTIPVEARSDSQASLSRAAAGF